MTAFFTILLLLGLVTALAYCNASVIVWTGCIAAYLLGMLIMIPGLWAIKIVICLLAVLYIVPLYLHGMRRRFLIKPLLAFYRNVMPKMSETEQQAIEAGDVTWEKQLFSGAPNWQELLDSPVAKLTDEERDFLNGPVAELCSLLDDWEITHEKADLPNNVWDFLKSQGFFALLIPKEYGGRGFSELAHSAVLVRVAGYSVTAASIITVPNSLGPAELLIKYGTEAQKQHYLPRLASGKDIPCFALTAPNAGSDAGSIQDYGIVCKGSIEGKETLGVKLFFNKRYITLAPVATVIGLAFKLYDPDELLGDKKEYGMTCALIPRDCPGITIGRRHFPLNVPFQNGPIQGEAVFIPLTYIIGGVDMAGQGWRMLMECLSAGRAISLPSNAVGGAKMAVATTGAYARIRRQFNLSIGQFEGVGAKLGEMAGLTNIMDSVRLFTAATVNQGFEPAIASAITKYHVTEMSRIVANHAMDIHGGKGICLGPNNYLGRSYQGIPIGITVEGANILTRCLIIFGQGAIRCHPFLLQEMQIAGQENNEETLKEFDRVLLGHVRHIMFNKARAFVMGLTHSCFVKTPRSSMKRYYQHFTRLSAAYAFIVDVMSILMGSQLKRREMISARLGDVLSSLYLGSAVLKQYADQGELEEDKALVQWSCDYLLFQAQRALIDVTKNFPVKGLGPLLRFTIFPLGQRFHYPSDKLTLKLADYLLKPNGTRDRLLRGMDLSCQPEHPSYHLEKLLAGIEQLEKYEKQVLPQIESEHLFKLGERDKLNLAHQQGLIADSEKESLLGLITLRHQLLQVDDFAAHELSADQSLNTVVESRSGQKVN